ncbi:MAG: hypothetical protein QM695_06335 [Micropruina sp.]
MTADIQPGASVHAYGSAVLTDVAPSIAETLARASQGRWIRGSAAVAVGKYADDPPGEAGPSEELP